MTIPEIVKEVINAYVQTHGTFTTMSRKDLYQLVSNKYSIKYSSFLPSDYCYNRTNDGIHFERNIHLFEYICKDCYRLLGENYPYTGTVVHQPKGLLETTVGQWNQGIFTCFR